VDDAGHIFAGDIQLAAVDGPATDKHRIEVALQLRKGNVLADSRIQMDLDAQIFDNLDLRPENVLGEPVFGNAHGKPAAGHRQGFEYLHRVAFGGEVIGAGEPRGSGAHNGHLLPVAFLLFGEEPGFVLQIQIGDKALQVHDVDRLFHLAAHTGRLAGMVADPAADDGEGIVFLDELQRFLILARGNQGHVALDADVGGAGRLAGGRTQLVDGEPAGDGLGEMPVGGLSVAQVLVEIGLDRDGTDGGTVAAARALGEIDEPGRLRELDGEAARLALDGLHRPAGQDLHVGMPADLDEFRGENAGRTVVGGERLVELGHDPANADPVFYHVDLHPGIGEVQGGLDPGDPGSHHHHGADFSILLMFRHVTTSVFESKLKRLFHRATQAKPQAP